MSDASTTEAVECPICGDEFDPTVAGGWCTNTECGEWQYTETATGDEQTADDDELVSSGETDDDGFVSPSEMVETDDEDVADDAYGSVEDKVEAEEDVADDAYGAVDDDGGAAADSSEDMTADDAETADGVADDAYGSVDDNVADDEEDDVADDAYGSVEDNVEDEEGVAEDAYGSVDDDVEADADVETVADEEADDAETADAEGVADDAYGDVDDNVEEEEDVADDAYGAVEDNVEDDEEDVAEDAYGAVDDDVEDDATIDCPGCDTELDADVNFCPDCGTDVSDVSPATSLDACPSCDADVDADDSFCVNCGEDLDAHRSGATEEEPEDALDALGADDDAVPASLVLAVEGREIPVDDGEKVGREVRAALMDAGRPEEEAVRIHREHVRFVREENSFYLLDLGDNPTKLNGQTLTKGDREPVAPGDELELSGVATVDVRAP